MCNDRAVLGPWVNKPWLNVVAAVILALLVMLSLILAAATIFPDLDATTFAAVLGVILVASLGVMGVVSLVQHIRRGPDPELVALSRMDRNTWRRGSAWKRA